MSLMRAIVVTFFIDIDFFLIPLIDCKTFSLLVKILSCHFFYWAYPAWTWLLQLYFLLVYTDTWLSVKFICVQTWLKVIFNVLKFRYIHVYTEFVMFWGPFYPECSLLLRFFLAVCSLHDFLSSLPSILWSYFIVVYTTIILVSSSLFLFINFFCYFILVYTIILLVFS